MGKRLDDGLTKWQRYRLKDLDRYRKVKREYAKTPEERAKRTAYMRVWREKNRDRHNELARQSHHRNKHKHVERSKDYALRNTVGISLQQKNEMIAAQNGICLICKLPFPSNRSTHVDHCHATGKVRGILCQSCNTKLGWYEKFSSAIQKYLL